MIITEKIFIIQPIINGNYRILHDEAISLIESAGADFCGSCFQNVKEINPATYIGAGKLNEIRHTLDGIENITVLFNGELSPSQTLNISAALDNRKVIDRTTLILDIFARNAVSSEGKIQVELAQLRYIYPRLKGKGAMLSKLGGGIGSRGPGETQLETDRRHIRYRIKYLEKRLTETANRRALQRERRAKENVKTIALVGYTNTGKSTLLNLLTNAEVLTKNALFATLDPTARKLVINGIDFLLVDTVGFIQELPHDIVEAFKSTLESALHCDLALIVADASGDYEMQIKTTLDTLNGLGFDKKFLKVLNKCDSLDHTEYLPMDCVCISAKNNTGIDHLKEYISDCFNDLYMNAKLFIPYNKLSDYANLKRHVKEKSRNYRDDGIEIDAVLESAYAEKFRVYIR